MRTLKPRESVLSLGLLFVFVVAFAACGGTGWRDPVQFGPGSWTVLDEEQAREAVGQCSRWTPRATGFWEVDEDVILDLEANLGRVSTMRASKCCLLRAWGPRHPHRFHRQYFGVVVGDRKLVYLNAYWPDSPQSPISLRAIDYCDGGNGYWGVLYDPETRRFSDLAYNGIG